MNFHGGADSPLGRERKFYTTSLNTSGTASTNTGHCVRF
jgi:hypothetical protein